MHSVIGVTAAVALGAIGVINSCAPPTTTTEMREAGPSNKVVMRQVVSGDQKMFVREKYMVS